MIDDFQFSDRVKKLYASQQGMAAAKKWKTGPRAGQIRVPAVPLHFTREQLHGELMRLVGFGCILCPYCQVPIDILSLTLDHIVPRAAGGAMTLANLDAICRECNEMKGPLTHEAFSAIMRFMETLSPYDRKVFRSRLKAAHHGSMQRFGRDKAAKEKQAQSGLRAASAQTPTTRDFWSKLGSPYNEDF